MFGNASKRTKLSVDEDESDRVRLDPVQSIYPHAYVQAYEEHCRADPALAAMAAHIDTKLDKFGHVLRNLGTGVWPPGYDEDSVTLYDSDATDSSDDDDDDDDDMYDSEGEFDLPDRIAVAASAKEPRWSAPWKMHEITVRFTYDDPDCPGRQVALRVLPPSLPLHPHYIPVFVLERIRDSGMLSTVVDVLDPLYSHLGSIESGISLEARRRSDTVEFVRLMQRAVLSVLTGGMAREQTDHGLARTQPCTLNYPR